MVEVMRNATMPWFLKQEKAVKDSIITLARRKVLRIKEEYDKREEERRLQRKTREAEEEKGKRKKQKLEERDERLAQLTKVETPEQLEEELTNIQCSTTRKTEVAELHFLRDQLQILFPRKRITLTENGKKRTVNDLKEQFLEALTSKSQTQIGKGKQVKHKLKDDETGLDEWYGGFIVDVSKDSVTIRYNDYSEEFTWPTSLEVSGSPPGPPVFSEVTRADNY